MNIPQPGEIAEINGHRFTVTRRTRNRDTGEILLWDRETPYNWQPPRDIQPGDVVHRKSKQGWTGEVISIQDGKVDVYLLPDKWFEKTAPKQTWQLSDCKLTEHDEWCRKLAEKAKAEKTKVESKTIDPVSPEILGVEAGLTPSAGLPHP